MKGMTILFLVMIASLAVAFFWNQIPFIPSAVHFILDPTAGAILNLNKTIGMLVIVVILTLFTTLIQKFGTDQEKLREIKQKQKESQEKIKQHKDNPQKALELQKEMMGHSMEMMQHSMKPLLYTSIPFVLFFRWFSDYFISAENFLFFGFMSWFIFYLIFAVVLSSIFKKILKVA
jgi:uncharacterized membrane protein (DUF106 family)